MGLARFYSHDLKTGEVSLDESESNHAARVLRSQVGDEVVLFDGRGNEGFGRIQSIARRCVVVEIESTQFAPRDHQGRLAIAVALPKGDRQRSVIEKMVELGVDHWIPIETERSVAKIDSDAFVRLNRIMMESCKQSSRNRFLHMHPPQSWSAFVDDMAWENHRRWVLHPQARDSSPQEGVFGTIVRSAYDAPGHPEAAPSVLFAVGPEGGFSEAESQTALLRGFQILSAGDRVMRVETAVAFAAVLGHLLIDRR
jgi:16S rRNA (uracil1498-N3)-methyltransferase